MIKVLKKDLANALKLTSHVMDSKPIMPIMQFAKLQLAGDHLYIDAGNISDHAFARIPASGEDTIGYINPKILLNILPSLGDEVEMKPHKNKLQIKRSSGNILLATPDSTNFPEGPKAKDATDWIGIPREAVRDMAATLLCGTEETEVTPSLWQNVALFRCGTTEFIAVSSDGKRTAVAEGKCSGPDGAEILIPIRALRSLYQLVQGLDPSITHIEVGQDEKRVWIRLGDEMRMVYAKIATDFPDIFGKVLDKLKFDREVKVGGAMLDTALNLIRTIGDEKDPAFRLEASGKQLTFATEGKDRGEVSEAMDVESLNGFEGFTTGYNADFLTPIFRQIDGMVTIQWAEMTQWSDKNYPLKVIHEGEFVRSSWLIQSRNIYPGSPPLVGAAEVTL